MKFYIFLSGVEVSLAQPLLDMYKYNQDDINLLASHINSTARDSLNGATPFDLAELLLDKKIPALTGQHKVSPDSVMLKPALIEHRDH